MKTQQRTITEALSLANRLDGLRSFGPEHFVELQSAVNTIRALVNLVTACQKDESPAATKQRCRIFELGTAPRAAELGYYLARTTYGTDQELQTRFGDQDVILVRGAACVSMIGAHEFAVFLPAPSYTVLSALKSQGWYQRALEEGLWPIYDKGGFSEVTCIFQDGDQNRLTLTQHKQRDLPLDSSGFNAGQHAIADSLVKLGLLEIIPRVAEPSAAQQSTC